MVKADGCKRGAIIEKHTTPGNLTAANANKLINR